MTPLDVAHAMFACIDAGDWKGLADLTSDDYVMHEPPELPFGGDWRGRDAMTRLFAHVMGYWNDPVIVREGILGDERQFVAILKMSMTSKLTGNRITQSLAEATRCVDGKMIETTIHYFNPAEVAREAGPRRPGAPLQEA